MLDIYQTEIPESYKSDGYSKVVLLNLHFTYLPVAWLRSLYHIRTDILAKFLDTQIPLWDNKVHHKTN